MRAGDSVIRASYTTKEAGVVHATHVHMTASLLVCVLGRFKILQLGQPVTLLTPHMRALLHLLALVEQHRLHRDRILEAIWPGHDESLSRQSLNSLIYSMRRLLGDALFGAPPVIHTDDGYYELNLAAGVAVDASYFDMLVDQYQHLRRAGQSSSATAVSQCAIELYQGDLELFGSDLRLIVERERLRNRYLSLLSQLSNDYFAADDYWLCVATSQRLLETDPCREDAHRLLMRCFVRLGERAAAMRQYRACADILRLAFDAEPEQATVDLFELTRSHPGSV